MCRTGLASTATDSVDITDLIGHSGPFRREADGVQGSTRFLRKRVERRVLCAHKSESVRNLVVLTSWCLELEGKDACSWTDLSEEVHSLLSLLALREPSQVCLWSLTTKEIQQLSSQIELK